MTQDESFKAWWFNEGSQPPYTHHDCEEHTMRMCEIAWNEAVKAEREACVEACEKTITSQRSAWGANFCIAAIRARGQA
jgi:hypothetical protein